MNPLISVVIPIYKVEKYLPRCVESVLSQTYRNLEIFLVDDGSPDNCGRICDEYAAKDPRVKVIHKPNGGLSHARNAAIDVMRGEYVTFIDSDDSVSSGHVEILYGLITKYGADISVAALLNVYEEETVPAGPFSGTEYLFSREEALKTMFYQDKFDNAACGKLYNSGLFRQIRYPDGMIYEDFGTTYKLLLLSNKVAYTSQPTYFYLQRSGSIERSQFSDRNMDALPLAQEMLTVIRQNLPDCYKAAVCRIVSLYWHILLQMPAGHPNEKEVVSLIKRYRRTVISDPHSRPKNRLACISSLSGLGTVRYLFSLFRKRK